MFSKQELKELAAYHSETSPILSVYLNVDSTQVTTEQYRLTLRGMLKSVADRATPADIEAIERYIEFEYDRQGKGLVIISGGDYWREYTLAFPVDDGIHVGAQPYIKPLADYADAYEAKPQQFKGDGRHPIEKTYDHPSVVYETGKCIKCGLCVRITEQHEELGLTFIGRGFDVRVGTPLNRTLDRALTKAAEDCVRACPTGALALRANGKHQPEKS